VLDDKQKRKPAIRPNIWRMIMKSRIISKLAVAAMVVIAVVVGIHYFGATGVAWGQLVEKIESVESVVYHLTTNAVYKFIYLQVFSSSKGLSLL
jgi:hypothetical protein